MSGSFVCTPADLLFLQAEELWFGLRALRKKREVARRLYVLSAQHGSDLGRARCLFLGMDFLSTRVDAGSSALGDDHGEGDDDNGIGDARPVYDHSADLDERLLSAEVVGMPAEKRVALRVFRRFCGSLPPKSANDGAEGDEDDGENDNGDGVDSDDDEWVTHYPQPPESVLSDQTGADTLAAPRGSYAMLWAASIFRIACFFMHGEGGVAENHAAEAGWYEFCLRHFDHAQAQFNLGCLYDDGSGLAQDQNEAVRLFRLSADAGCLDARYNLGCMYRDGDGVKKDASECHRYFGLARGQGDADAHAALGFLFAQGEGVPRSTDRAIAFYRESQECEVFDTDIGDGMSNRIKRLQARAEQKMLHAESVEAQREALADGESIIEAIAGISGAEMTEVVSKTVLPGDNVLHAAAREASFEAVALFFEQPEFDRLFEAQNEAGLLPRDVFPSAAKEDALMSPEEGLVRSILSFTRRTRVACFVWCWHHVRESSRSSVAVATVDSGTPSVGPSGSFVATLPPELVLSVAEHVRCPRERTLGSSERWINNCLRASRPRPMIRFTLGYWDDRCIAEPLRIGLSALVGPDSWIDKRYDVGPPPLYDKSSWLNERAKSTMLFPNLPYLIDHRKGLVITQTRAIARYLSREFKDDMTAEDRSSAQVIKVREDQLCDYLFDCWDDLFDVVYCDWPGFRGCPEKNVDELPAVHMAGSPSAQRSQRFEELLHQFFLEKWPTITKNLANFLLQTMPSHQKVAHTNSRSYGRSFLFEFLDQCLILVPHALRGHTAPPAYHPVVKDLLLPSELPIDPADSVILERFMMMGEFVASVHRNSDKFRAEPVFNRYTPVWRGWVKKVEKE